MGCECSKQPKDLKNDAKKQALINVKNTDPQTKTDVGSSSDYPDVSTSSDYYDPDIKEDDNVCNNLIELLGESRRQDIENAIDKVIDKTDIDGVCQYLLDPQNKQKPIHDAVDSECKQGINLCDHFKRIETVLKVYGKWIKKKKKKENIYDIIHKLGGKYELKQILDDYHHLIYCHSDDYSFMYIHRKLSISITCRISKCLIIGRHYRNRMEFNRNKLYFKSTESTVIILIQLLDKIHCHYSHCFDIGMKFTMKEKLSVMYSNNNNNNDDNKLTDNKIIKMNDIIKNKQINLIKILGKDRFNRNKFRAIYDSKQDDISDIDPIKKENILYYYNPKTDKFGDIAEEIGTINEGNYGYAVKDWFIQAKYSDLKEELTNNKLSNCNITIQEWNDLSSTAKLYILSQRNTTLRNSTRVIDADNLETESWGMNNQHVIALMVYCNYSVISYELRRTYRRIPYTESDIDLRKRHSHFGNLGCLLKECVNDYGTECDYKSSLNTFYRNVSIKLLHRTFIYYRGPASCSSSQIVLFSYTLATADSQDTIIELSPGYCDLDRPKYFDCEWISDYSIEYEKLFLSAEHPLELKTIINPFNAQNYRLYVIVMNIINIAFGDFNESQSDDKPNLFDAISKKKQLQKIVTKLLQKKASKYFNEFTPVKSNKKDNDLILEQLLEYYCVSKKEMMLFWFSDVAKEHYKWMSELLDFMQNPDFFCKSLNDNVLWLRLDLIVLMFYNVEKITIIHKSLDKAILDDIIKLVEKLEDKTPKKKKKDDDNDDDDDGVKIDMNNMKDIVGLADVTDKPSIKKQDSDGSIDKLAHMDIDGLFNDIKSNDKSHISFQGAIPVDLNNYNVCKLNKICINESDDDDFDNSFVSDKILKKYQKKFAKLNWTIEKGKVVGKNGIIIYRKSNLSITVTDTTNDNNDDNNIDNP